MSKALEIELDLFQKSEDRNDLLKELSKQEFSIFSSPRYYRFFFKEYTPTTKNGDLVAAINEMRHSNILTYDSEWENISLTKKGKRLKNIIKKLLEAGAMNIPQQDGLFDYRTETGRLIILKFLSFIHSKFNFQELIDYLDLPIFLEGKEEENPDKDLWDKLKYDGDKKDTEETWINFKGIIENIKERQVIHEKSKKIKIKNKKVVKHIEKQPFQLNQIIVKRFIQINGLNRPKPLINHLNAESLEIFSLHNKNLLIDLFQVNELNSIFKRNIFDFEQEQSIWIREYLNLLQLPSSIYGVKLQNNLSLSSIKDAYLNVGIEAPIFFGEQLGNMIKRLGDLQILMMPLNLDENLIIYNNFMEIGGYYFFTQPISQCTIQITKQLFGQLDAPEIYITSNKKFGKLINFSKTLHDVLQEQNLAQRKDESIEEGYSEKNLGWRRKREISKIEKAKIKVKEKEMQDRNSSISYYSASLFSISQLLVEKMNQNFFFNKMSIVFEKGLVEIQKLSEDYLETNIVLGEIKLDKNLVKIVDKFKESMNLQ